MEFNEIKIFGEKTLSDLFQDIYTNQSKTQSQIDEAIKDLKELVLSISDATILSPIIKDYLDTTVKNNDILIKMAAIIEKSIQKQLESNPQSSQFEISEEEAEELRQLYDKNFQQKIS